MSWLSRLKHLPYKPKDLSWIPRTLGRRQLTLESYFLSITLTIASEHQQYHIHTHLMHICIHNTVITNKIYLSHQASISGVIFVSYKNSSVAGLKVS